MVRLRKRNEAMRKDMNRKLVERPRWGHSARNADVRFQRARMRHLTRVEDYDSLSTHSKMRPRVGMMKCLNENLAFGAVFEAPGRPWNKVYSEIRKTWLPRLRWTCISCSTCGNTWSALF